MARSLIDRGASTIVGWDRLVDASRNDIVMLSFLESVLVDDIEIQQAIELVVEEYNLDLESLPTFSYYDQNL